MSRATWVTEHERRAILALLELGLTDAQVAEKVGRTPGGIRQVRVRNGVPTKAERIAARRAAELQAYWLRSA